MHKPHPHSSSAPLTRTTPLMTSGVCVCGGAEVAVFLSAFPDLPRYLFLEVSLPIVKPCPHLCQSEGNLEAVCLLTTNEPSRIREIKARPQSSQSVGPWVLADSFFVEGCEDQGHNLCISGQGRTLEWCV